MNGLSTHDTAISQATVILLKGFARYTSNSRILMKSLHSKTGTLKTNNSKNQNLL